MFISLDFFYFEKNDTLCCLYIGAQANHLKDVGCISFYFQLILKFVNSGRCTVKERTFLKL